MSPHLNKIIYFATICACSVAIVRAQQDSIAANIPGAKTVTGILASSVDGLSRYFAPDGPIQPAITAIGGLPLRGVELINNGITRVSSGLDSGAKSLANSAGNDGTIQMPGMQSLRSSMPTSLSNLGGMMQSAIQGKNGFIRGQAESAVQAGERLRSMMQQGLQSRKKRAVTDIDPLSSASTMLSGSMISGMQDTMMKGGQQIKSQLQQSLSGHMNRLQSMHGMGDNLRNQAQGISRTLSSGLQGTVEHLQRTGQQVSQQLQGGLKQNMGAMSGVMDSMHGSMGNMGQNMQKNVHGVMRTAQNAVQQVTSHIQQAASGPLSMLQNMGNSLGNMMKGGISSMSGGHKSGGGY